MFLYSRRFILPAIVTAPIFGCGDGGLDSIEKPPNIIFVFTDDHASHAVSAYGSEIMNTPNIDRLADEGILFHNAFVTNSICAPSRAVLLTGKHSHINGQLTNAQVFDGEQMTYPQLMQDAGYRTAMIGKWHLRSDPTGYDHWEILPGQGHYYNPVFRSENGESQMEGYVTDIITDKVIDWIDNARKDNKPFLVNYHHKAPHRNWKPGPEQLGMFDNIELPEPPTLYANWSGELSGEPRSGRTSAVQTQEMTLMEHFSPAWDLKFPPNQVQDAPHSNIWTDRYARFADDQRAMWDEYYSSYYEEYQEAELEGEERLAWIYQRYIKDYLTTIASVDDNLGRLIDYLDEENLTENTVIIYTSDQGFFLGDHGWYDKRWMYEESLHIPLVIRWPEAIQVGKENTELVQNLDFAPTLLDLAGIDIPEEMQGRSLLPMMLGESPSDWRESIYYHYYEYPGPHSVQKHYGIRTNRYKLIHYYELEEWELFDLIEDPDEYVSVYDESDYSDIVQDLKNELRQLKEYYQVPEEDPM